MLNNTRVILLIFALSLLFSKFCLAATPCTVVFGEALQSNASSGSIQMSCGSQVINNPDTSLSTPSITNPNSCSTKTCVSINCTATGSPVPTLNPGGFQSNTGGGNTSASSGNLTLGGINNATKNYADVNLTGGGSLNFTKTASSGSTTTYYIGNLNMTGGMINFQPGDYWISNLSLNNVRVNLVGGAGTARLFVQNINFNELATPSISAHHLFIYNYSNLNLNQTTPLKAVIYAVGNINLNNTKITGSVTGATINVANSTVTYDPNVANTDFGPNFPSCRQPILNSINVSAGATTANSCQAVTYTVQMLDLNGNPVTNYTGAISINTQTGFGTWSKVSGSGTLTNLGNGLAQYTFTNTDNSVASFSLVYPANGPTPMTVRVSTVATPMVSGLAQPISYMPSQLLVTAVPVTTTPPPAAYNSTIKAGNNTTLYLTAYSGSSCGVTTSYTGTKSIRFYTNYINPTTGTKNLFINGIAVANSAGASATSQNITFTNGQASVIARYPDVGMLTLFVDDTSTNGPNGQSGNFVIIPDHFAIQVSPTNSAMNDITGTAVASCLADNKFIGAGQNFTVNVQPQNLQNMVTPNFGNETTAQTIALTGPVIAPVNGSGILNAATMTKVVSGGSNPFSAYPFFKATPNFSDVGCINLTARVSNYIVAGATVSNSIVVGRFVPDHFAIQTSATVQPILHTANTHFTYLDQPFAFATAPKLVIQAQNAQNAVTQNYTGQFAKLFLSGLTYQYVVGSTPVTAGDVIPVLSMIPSANMVSALPNVSNGTATYTFSDGGSGFKIARQAGILVPPFYAEMQLQVPTIVDSDMVQCDSSCRCLSGVNGCSASPNTNRGFSFGNTTPGNGMRFDGTGSGVTKGKLFYFGRMVVVDSIGTELSSLSVPLQTQYYTSSGFVLNTNDSTTPSSAFASPNTPQTCPASGSPNPLLCGSGISTNIVAPFPATFAAGQANITLSAPHALGYVDVIPQLQSTAANLPWLQFSWPANSSNPTGVFTDNPRGRATFGISKGNDRIIYEKEQFQ